jgi:hypothetical protein
LKELDKLEDNGRKRGNTIAGSRCCSDSWCKKTEEKSVEGLFKLVSFDRELNNI